MAYRVIISLFMVLALMLSLNYSDFGRTAESANPPLSKKNYVPDQEKKHILVLNSYHADMPWVQMQEHGIKSVLDLYPELTLYFDYMDTKRNIGNHYLEELYKLYTYKYEKKNFDAVIVTDDVAYQFILQHQEKLFPGIPIVFCGVNFFDEAQLAGNQWVTGVVEVVDMKKTIKLALQLHPQINKMVVINDKTTVGISNKLLLEQIIPEFSPKIEFIIFEDMTMEEVLEQVAILDQKTVILLMTWNVDKDQKVFSYEESSDLIAAHSSVPIYGTWDFYFGHGVVGGMMTSGYRQGEKAAELVCRILFAQEQPNQIAVLTESINQYMFDYNNLIEADLKENVLPLGSIIVNKPVSFYDTYRDLVWLLVLSFITLLVLVMVLFINISRRKRGEKEILQLNAELETRVLDRTYELQHTNDELTKTLGDLQQTRNHLVEFEKMASLGELVAGVAHEINTPIGNSITAISHLDIRTTEIKEKFSNGLMKKSDFETYLAVNFNVIKIIFTNLERAAQLIRSFKKIAVDQSVEEQRYFDLCEYMNDVLISLKPQLKKAQHKIILNCPMEVKVYWHPGTLWQIMSNFLNNSLLHAYDEGEVGIITIDISHKDGFVVLQYSDDGKGMLPEVQKKVFEPFFTTRRGTGGSGLGMHIVYNLVVFRMGGSIECMSKLGVGTVFTLKLPDITQKQGGTSYE